MGGSRGRGPYFTTTDQETMRVQAAERINRGRIDADVNSLLQHELVEVNDRDVERINRDLEQIEHLLEGQVEGFDRLLFGGSVAKRTYVDGLSDVDALVILNDKSLESKSPVEVLEQFRDLLMRRLPQGRIDNISVGNMAVRIVYRDEAKIELLPAIQTGGEISISSNEGEDWARIEPRRFAEKLTDTNRRQGGAVVPAIKLAKVLFASTLGDVAPTGYHVEALAIAAFENYNGPRTPKSMLLRLISSASHDVLRHIRDTTGQSDHLDEYLGDSGSTERRRLARSLENLGKNMTSGSIDYWQALFE